METEAQRVNAPVQILGAGKELVLLGLPLIILFLAWAETALNWNPAHNLRQDLSLLVDVLFLSSLHVIFTFQLAFTNPVYFKLLTAKHGKWGMATLMGLFLIFIALNIVQVNSNHIVETFIFFGLTAFLYYHTAKQFLGLSLMYNVKARRENLLTSKLIPVFSRAEAFERRGVKFHIFGMTLQSAIVAAYELNGREMPMWIRHVFVIAGALLIGVMIYLYFRTSPQVFRYKMLFMLRYLTMLLAFYSFWAFLGTKLVHGVEYYMIYRRIQSHNRKLLQKSPKILYVFTYSLALIVILSNFLNPAAGLGLNREGIFGQFIMVVAGGLTWFHYYLDGILFSMKDPKIRQQTGEWLLSDKT